MTTDRDQRISDLYHAGKGLRQIGREVNLSHVGVKKALVRLGLVTANSTPGPEQPPSIKDIQKGLLEIHSIAESLTSLGNPYSPSFVRGLGCRIVALTEKVLQGGKKGW